MRQPGDGVFTSRGVTTDAVPTDAEVADDPLDDVDAEVADDDPLEDEDEDVFDEDDDALGDAASPHALATMHASHHGESANGLLLTSGPRSRSRP